MQWLIDLIAAKVIAEIGATGAYVDRGDPSSFDFTLGDFTLDNAWHPLNLSAVIPVDTSLVAIQVVQRCIISAQQTVWRKAGNTNEKNVSAIIGPVANTFAFGTIFTPVNTARRCEYKIQSVSFNYITATVKGWWL